MRLAIAVMLLVVLALTTIVEAGPLRRRRASRTTTNRCVGGVCYGPPTTEIPLAPTDPAPKLDAETKAKQPAPAPKALSMYHGTDQERCQAEALHMARYGIRGHVGVCIGRFEGCGWSSGGTPGTCTPSRGMTLTGDAMARSKYGTFRVRSWR